QAHQLARKNDGELGERLLQTDAWNALGPAAQCQLIPLIDHDEGKREDYDFTEAAQPAFADLRQYIELLVKAKVKVLSDANSSAQEDEPTHDHDRTGFGPGRRRIDDVAHINLVGDDKGHGDQPHASDPQGGG